MLSVEEFGLEVRARMLSDKYDTIHAHKWVIPVRKKIEILHTVLQVR